MRLTLSRLPASDKMSYVKLEMGAIAILLGKLSLRSERPSRVCGPVSPATEPRIGLASASRPRIFNSANPATSHLDRGLQLGSSHRRSRDGFSPSVDRQQHHGGGCAISRRPPATCTCRRQPRAAVPDMAFSTDFIVGFPWETADDLEATLALVRKVTTARRTADKGENVGAPTFGRIPDPERVRASRRWRDGWHNAHGSADLFSPSESAAALRWTGRRGAICSTIDVAAPGAMRSRSRSGRPADAREPSGSRGRRTCLVWLPRTSGVDRSDPEGSG